MTVGAGIDRPGPASHRAFQRDQAQRSGLSRYAVTVVDGDQESVVQVAGEAVLLPPPDQEKTPLVVMGSSGRPVAIFAAGSWRYVVDVEALDHQREAS